MTKQELLNRLRLLLSGYQEDIRLTNASLDHAEGEVEAFYDGQLSILPALCDELTALIADLEREGAPA